METPLFGKNLCNLLCNKIIQEFYSIDEYHSTEIKVVNLEQFIIIKGKTTITNPLNYSQLFKTYLSDLSKIDKTFNVIDLVEYGAKPKLDFINLNLSFTNSSPLDIFNLSDELQGEYNIDLDKNLIITTNKRLFEYIISNPEYKDLDGKYIDLTYPYVSDSMFGKSLYSDKIYETYLKYISYNLFEKQLCKDITFNLFYSGEISDINWETIIFDVSSDTNIPSTEWIKSLVLDLFDFNYKVIIKHLSLDTYDFSNEILSNDRCWMLRDKTSEMILL